MYSCSILYIKINRLRLYFGYIKNIDFIASLNFSVLFSRSAKLIFFPNTNSKKNKELNINNNDLNIIINNSA